MSLATNARTMSYLGQHAEEVAKHVTADEPMLITQNGAITRLAAKHARL